MISSLRRAMLRLICWIEAAADGQQHDDDQLMCDLALLPPDVQRLFYRVSRDELDARPWLGDPQGVQLDGSELCIFWTCGAWYRYPISDYEGD